MNQYEEIRKEIDSYLMKRFKYRLSLTYLTPDNVIATRRNSRVDLYLRIRRVESIFPLDCLIIARISFRKERIGHGTHFVRFLSEIALKYGFKHIGIESVNEKSSGFAEKLGFHSIDGSNYAVSVNNLIYYFQKRIRGLVRLFPKLFPAPMSVISRSWLPCRLEGRKPAGITNGTRITSTVVGLWNGTQ